MNNDSDKEKKEKSPGFIKEIVKGKGDRKNFLKALISFIVIAAAAAFTAAFVFVYTVRNLSHKDKDAMMYVGTSSASSATKTASEESHEASEEENETGTGTVEIVQTAPERTDPIQSVREFYSGIKENAQKIRLSQVKITVIEKDKDIFQQTIESKKEILGLIFRKNSRGIYIMANNSAFENPDQINVRLEDGTILKATYIRGDREAGLCVLMINKEDMEENVYNNIQVAKIQRSKFSSASDPVIAVGDIQGIQDSFAYGMITATTNKEEEFDGEYNLISTDIIGSSKSEGVLLNMEGQVIGYIVAQERDRDVNVVEAYSVSQMDGMLDRLCNNQPKGYVGIKAMDITPELLGEKDIPKGIMIKEIQEDSPAMKGGLMKGDIITAINGQSTENILDYTNILKELKPKEKATITAKRKIPAGYGDIEINIEIGEA